MQYRYAEVHVCIRRSASAHSADTVVNDTVVSWGKISVPHFGNFG